MLSVTRSNFCPVFVYFWDWSCPGSRRFPTFGCCSYFLAATAHSLWLYYTTYDKEQWREVAQFIGENVKSGEAVVLSAPWIYEPFTYYLPDDGDPKIIQAFSHMDLRGETNKYDTIWLVQAHEFFSDPGGEIPAMLSENRLIKQHKDFKEGVKTNPILVHFQSIRPPNTMLGA